MKKIKKVAAKKKAAAKRTVSYQRIFILGSLVAILAIIAIPNLVNLRQAVEGVSVQYGQFDKAVIPLPNVSNAVSFNIYYGLSSSQHFTNAARAIPASYASYTINYLRLNTTYKYRISAKDGSGKEIYWTPVQTITNETSM